MKDGLIRRPPGQTCEVPGCERPAKGRGLCVAHLQRLRRIGSVQADVPIRPRERRYWKKPPGAICASPICRRPVYARGLCEPHYSRLRRFGDAKLDKPVQGDRV